LDPRVRSEIRLERLLAELPAHYRTAVVLRDVDGFSNEEAAELLQAATVAVVGEVPLASLRHAIPAFPTRSEV
jgi:DNA-directed RNA polymerase specialized sigma24 family protein